jgi:plastocyanin
MRRLLPLLLLVTIPAGLALAAETHDVNTSGTTFSPKTITVAVGDTVKFHNKGGFHSVDFDDGVVDGTATSSEDLGQRTFDAPGSFGYHCEIHGGANGVGMSGTVVVQEPGSPTPTATPTPTVIATPSASGLKVKRRVRHAKLRGSVKARPPGAAVNVLVSRGSRAVGHLETSAAAGRTPFAVKLARSIRRALAKGRHPRVRVSVVVIDGEATARAHRSVRLRH